MFRLCAILCLVSFRQSASVQEFKPTTDELKEKIDNLTALYDTVTTHLYTLAAENKALHEHNDALHEDNELLQERITALETRLNATNTDVGRIDRYLYHKESDWILYSERMQYLKRSIDDLDKLLLNTNHKIERIDGDVMQLDHSLDDVKWNVNFIDDSLSYLTYKMSKRDGFLAYVHKKVFLVEDGGIVPFNHLLFQIGPGFDTNTYTYTCQQNGLYLFSTSIVNYFYWQKGSARLVKDGVGISTSVHMDTFAGEWNQGSVSAVTACRQGERVWVQGTGKSRLHGGDERQSFTQFMGVLLQIDL